MIEKEWATIEPLLPQKEENSALYIDKKTTVQWHILSTQEWLNWFEFPAIEGQKEGFSYWSLLGLSLAAQRYYESQNTQSNVNST